jgi:hypothetical protein
VWHRRPLVGALPAGAIDEDLPHQPGRDRKEVRSARRRHAIRRHESQEDFVHEGRRLQGVSSRLSFEMTPRHAPQFVVDQRHQTVERRRVSLVPGRQQAGYVGRAGVVRHRFVRGKHARLRLYLIGRTHART